MVLHRLPLFSMVFSLGRPGVVDPNLVLISGLPIHALRVLEQTSFQEFNADQLPRKCSQLALTTLGMEALGLRPLLSATSRRRS